MPNAVPIGHTVAEIYRDFWIFQDVCRRHLGFVMRVLGTWDHPQRAFGGLYHCAKFGWNRCSNFDRTHVFDFASLA